jgi:hypothetical protein
MIVVFLDTISQSLSDSIVRLNLFFMGMITIRCAKEQSLTILLVFVFCCTVGQLYSRNFYFANNGSDSYSTTQAQNAVTPWNTIDKLNNFMASLLPGDSVLFKRGDVFVGQITNTTVSGNAANAIVFSAYGVGANPVISGAIAASGWTNHSGNIWKCSVGATSSEVKIIFKNGSLTAPARFPNVGFNYVTSLVSGNANAFVDNTLTQSSGFFVGSKIAIRDEYWDWVNTTVTSFSSESTVVCDAIQYGAKLKSGYYFYDAYNLLDVQDEWYFDDANDVLYFYSTTNPTSLGIEVSVFDHGFFFDNSRSYIAIIGLDIIKQNLYGIRAILKTLVKRVLSCGGSAAITHNRI